MKIDKYIQKIITDPSRSLRERVFIVLTLASTVVCALALIGDILYGDNVIEITTLAITTVIVPIITMISIRTNTVDLVAKLISFGVICGILPIVFFFGGSAEGAVIPWMIFAYLYMGLILSGWWRVGALIMHTAIIIASFVYGYYHPELTAPYTREVRYIDVALAVIEVGYICFVMAWFQNLLFMQENKMAKEETKKVEELSRSQNRFFSNMSHEIRTPINSILGLNEVILRDPDATESIRKDAGNIQGAGRMLLALINDILDFSKIEAGKMDIVPVNYSTASLISEIVNMVWLRAEEKGLQLNVEVDPSIPSELYGDEVRIKQILINLLNNAVKYTREGSVTFRVEKETTEEDQIVLMFSVSDTGMGIKQDVMPYLFDAFRRVDEGRNARIEGTGLGLSIVKQFVDLMGGRITVDSIYTQGSTFTVTLRQKITRADAVGSIDIGSTVNSGGNPAKVHSASFTAPEARILIVDDSTMNLKVEKKLLEKTLITIDTATSGEEALNMTRTERYDVIFMDHLMPEMDGIECLQQIRKQVAGLNNRIPVIVLTANAETENRQMYARAGFEDYLLKPVTGHQLEEMLLAHLPASKVERAGDQDVAMARMNTSRDYSRKIPVLVTCAGTCDLPSWMIKKYHLEVIPYTVTSEGRTFYDGVEASGDELVRYIKEGKQFMCDPPSVEEYRTFFGSRLKYAHNLIYISAAPRISPEYSRACEAARSYDNVAVIETNCCSTAVGFLMLIASRMSARGDTFENIVAELERAKKRIKSAFVLDSTYFLSKSKPVREGVAIFLRALGVRAIIRIKDGGFSADRYIIGDFDRYYKKFIDHMMPSFSRPDKDIAVIVYAEMSDEQKEKIESYLRRFCDFNRIVFQRTSSVLPIHMGTEAFSLIYISDGDYSYDIGQMFVEDEAGYEAVRPEVDAAGNGQQAEDEKTVPEKAKESGLRWYENISGIDSAIGLKNTGSEETYRAVAEAFYASIDPDIEQINGFLESEDWKNYTVKIHALKSTSLLIGAKELADEALALETAGKKEDGEYIRNNNARTMELFRSYREKLKGAIDKE